MFSDKTRNQHYISVSEQKLNQIDQSNTDRKKIKIFSFDLIDREQHLIDISNAHEQKAVINLSYLDLYTFGLLDDGQRLCFEKLFKRLEDDVSKHTSLILDSTSFEVGSFLHVFKSKLLNMIRNPFCVKATLNNFNNLKNCYPTDESLKNYFNLIDIYEIPQDLLDEFSLTDAEYKDWLKIIFLIITPLKDEKFILDAIAENFFDLDKFYHSIYLSCYTDSVCLLSDRSYVDLSETFKEASGVSFGFNLRRDAFIYINFFPNDLEMLANTLLKDKPQALSVVKNLKDRGIKCLQTTLQINLHKDDIELLKKYNNHVIYQCAKNVYAASDVIIK